MHKEGHDHSHPHTHWRKPWHELWPHRDEMTDTERAAWKQQEKRARKARAEDPRPNILLVFTDQQTHDAMSCAGNAWCDTPNMDALAARGVRFSRAYTTYPACSPARSSLMTGRMPHETGVIFNDIGIDPDIPNLGQIFREAGYVTPYSGKWHLPESYVAERDGIPGFDNIPAPYDKMRRLHGLGDQVDFLFTMDAEFMLRWELHKVGQPWLYTISLHNPHDICHWTSLEPREHRNIHRYPPLPDNFDIPDDEPGYLGLIRESGTGNQEIPRTVGWDEDQWRAYIAAYYHMTQQVDRCVGLIFDALEEGGWADNTLVVFTSDHGDGCAAHHWVAKCTLYEEPTRVPLIVSFPGQVPEGEVDDRLVSLVDVLPTMCDYAGVAQPEDVRGRSLRPLFAGEEPEWRDFVVTELALGAPDFNRKGRMLRTDRYKYNVYSMAGRAEEQLFDLVEDPGEMVNRSDDPELSDVLTEHRNRLRQWARETDDEAALSILELPG